MHPGLGSPTHAELVEELGRVRGAGLIHLRLTSVNALARAARLAGMAHSEDARPQAVEDLIRAAAPRLGGRLQQAAEYTFGLVPGTRDWPGQDRRRRAAEVYRVGVDRFRKHYEKLIKAQLAEAILGLMPEPGVDPAPARPADLDAVRREIPTGHAGLPSVTVWCTSVDLIGGVDIVVCPTNVFFELAATYKRSIAACLRWAGAHKTGTGEIKADAVATALDAWRAAHTHVGHPVAAGTVASVPVDPGGDLRFRQIHHAAVAAPHCGTNNYLVDQVAVARATRNVFAIARRERAETHPPFSSICFPLIGAGRGGLDPEVSFTWMWRTIVEETAGDPGWAVHFVAIERDQADLVAGLIRPAAEEGRSRALPRP